MIDAKAEEFSHRFDMKAQWFREQIFYGGQKHINKRDTNTYNAFFRQKTQDLRDEGIVHAGGIVKLHELYADEYHAMSKEKLDELVLAHKEEQLEYSYTRVQGNRAKMQDIRKCCNLMMDLLGGLRQRVGIEGFFVVVSSNTDFPIDPIWFFTRDELDEYMKVLLRNWDTSQLGYKMQAFAQAGCDVANLTRSAHEKAQFLKGEIVRLVNQALVDITQDTNASMQYVQYERNIVYKRSVVLEGWPHDKLVQPSRMGNSIGQLERIRDALRSGTCYFRKIDKQEREERYRDYKKKVASGEIKTRPRKARSDKGIMKGPRVRHDEDDEDEDDGDEDDCDDLDDDGLITMDGNDDDEPISREAGTSSSGSHDGVGSSSNAQSTELTNGDNVEAQEPLSVVDSSRPKPKKRKQSVKKTTDGAPKKKKARKAAAPPPASTGTPTDVAGAQMASSEAGGVDNSVVSGAGEPALTS
ncbi:hypothetical protein FISHEDRAFT_76522 [Fistulina hepatica ATCC 64428]|uniref:Uncharacterized protein n=1 Tax=Fistulina hepatica ATCC 64428 TaxID=1128425 RepID=A0A0D7A3G9_9AGAR|nr:hypothetical protein FISHEDRAFT_76522 [Fistulina hepatica ATCC 64428]